MSHHNSQQETEAPVMVTKMEWLENRINDLNAYSIEINKKINKLDGKDNIPESSSVQDGKKKEPILCAVDKMEDLINKSAHVSNELCKSLDRLSRLVG